MYTMHKEHQKTFPMLVGLKAFFAQDSLRAGLPNSTRRANNEQRLAQAVRRWLPILLSALVAVVLAVLLLRTTHTSFAKTSSFETCATVIQQDKPKFCTGADPIQGGCSHDAQTVTQQPVMLGDQQVGLAEVRHSPSCNTYWARGVSYLQGKAVSVFVSNLGKSDTASYLSTSQEAYSNMVYATIPTVVVQVDVSPTHVANTTIAGVN